ncbi:MAG: MGMT family protein [Nocardioides sp.]
MWQQLREIGYGETSSYGEIAHRLGMTNAASRAVGLANGRNPIPIVIPWPSGDRCRRPRSRGTPVGSSEADAAGAEQDALF